MAEPTSRDRPEMPPGYGVPETTDGLLAWSDVDARLVESLHYWMATSRPDGRPHVVPRWGAWLDDRLFYDGSPETRHARNAVGNPACTLHIGDGREAIMLEGSTGASDPVGPELGGRIAAEIGRKYAALGYAPEADAWSDPEHAGGMMVFTPVKALAWFSFPADLTRFHFR